MTKQLTVSEPNTCTVADCDKKRISKGLCWMHYTRLLRWGKLERTFDDKVNSSYTVDGNGCWVVNRGLNKDGYAYMHDGTGKKVRLHKYTYERKNGAIANGLVCDHLCRVRNCINPDHIEAVTNRENVVRGIASRKRAKAKIERRFE